MCHEGLDTDIEYSMRLMFSCIVERGVALI